MIIDKNIKQFKSAFFKKICSIIPFRTVLSSNKILEEPYYWQQVKENSKNQYSENLTPFELLEPVTIENSEKENGIIFNIKKNNHTKSKKELVFEQKETFLRKNNF